MSIVATLTEEVGQNVIADIAEDAGAALVAKGVITDDEKAGVVGSINCIGNVALKAYFKNKSP